MAFNNSVIHQDVVGSSRMIVYSCVADAASGLVTTPLGRVYATAYVPVSLTTGLMGIKQNVGAASAVCHGVVQCSGVATGDVFYLTVYGR